MSGGKMKPVIDAHGALSKLGPHLKATWQVTTHPDKRVVALAYKVGEQEGALLLQLPDIVALITALGSAATSLLNETSIARGGD